MLEPNARCCASSNESLVSLSDKKVKQQWWPILAFCIRVNHTLDLFV